MDALYAGISISDENITVIHNIQLDAVSNYQIFFQAFDIDSFEVETQIINFNVIDTTSPNLSFIAHLWYISKHAICTNDLVLYFHLHCILFKDPK